jgi:pimeloyl-ACP methyl ester carboxylesterase
VTTVLSKLRSTGDSAPSSSHGSAERGRSVVLCGHDWGGVVAWNLAFLEHNEEVKSISKMVIANAPHPSVDTTAASAADAMAATAAAAANHHPAVHATEREMKQQYLTVALCFLLLHL